MNSPLWEEKWRNHLSKRDAPAEVVDEFWKIFIDEIIGIVTEDGVVDCREPENVEAWVGPSYVKLKFDRQTHTITARFWTQKKDYCEQHLFDKVLAVDENKADLGEFGISGFRSAAECGSVVAKFLFSLRTPKEE